MPISGGKFYNPQSSTKKRLRDVERRTYGEDYRITHWNIPLVTFWNRVPIFLRNAWHNNTVWNRRKLGEYKGKQYWDSQDERAWRKR